MSRHPVRSELRCRGERAPQVRHRFGRIFAMLEDVLVGDAHAEPGLDSRGFDAPFRIVAKPFHPTVGQRAKSCPDLGASRRDPEGRRAKHCVRDGDLGELAIVNRALAERSQRRHEMGHRVHRRDT
jgi:hypothetical protein